MLVACGVIPPKTHDLVKLLYWCADYDKNIFNFSRHAAFLNVYTTKARYPDDALIPSIEDIQNCLKLVEEVAAWFEEKLNLR